MWAGAPLLRSGLIFLSRSKGRLALLLMETCCFALGSSRDRASRIPRAVPQRGFCALQLGRREKERLYQ